MIKDFYKCLWDDKDIIKDIKEGKRPDLKIIHEDDRVIRCEVINSNK